MRVLTGINTTGTLHLGNYCGAIRPCVQASKRDDVESFFFMADLHALIKCHDPDRIEKSRMQIAASWLACGLDPERVTFYRQSDIPEIPLLNWMLSCVCSKGLMNRAHAYKAFLEANQDAGEDPDAGVSMGLFCYPVLMAADILMFNADRVPVGRDQIQKTRLELREKRVAPVLREMPRGVAGKFRDPFASLPRQESRGFVPQSIGGAHDRGGGLGEEAAFFECGGGLRCDVPHEGRIRLRVLGADHKHGRASVFVRHAVAKRLHDVRGEARRLGRKEAQKVRFEPAADGVR